MRGTCEPPQGGPSPLKGGEEVSLNILRAALAYSSHILKNRE